MAYSSHPLEQFAPSTTANVTSNFEQFHSVQAFEQKWLIPILLPLILCSVGGNSLVILAVTMERKLQNKINYFLQSLALADLMVSVLVMPLGLVDDIIGYWPFGQVMCNIWATLDVLNCTASILHMCVMSVERYLAICHPLYHRKQKHFHHNVGIKIALVWLISIALSSLLFILGQIRPEALYVDNVCRVQHTYFQLYGSIFAFFIPLVIVIVSYTMTAVKLFQKSRMYENVRADYLTSNAFARRVQSLRQDISEQGKIPEETDSEQDSELMQFSIHATMRRAKSLNLRSNRDTYPLERLKSHTMGGSGSLKQSYHGRKESTTLPFYDKSKGRQPKYVLTRHSSTGRTNSTGFNQSAASFNSNTSKEHQANIVLGFVFAAFVIAWTPFFLLNIYFALCTTCVPDDTVMLFFEWLGWASSLFNPFIYTFFNRNFRRTFWRLLQCHCFWGQKRRAKWNANRQKARMYVPSHESYERHTKV